MMERLIPATTTANPLRLAGALLGFLVVRFFAAREVELLRELLAEREPADEPERDEPERVERELADDRRLLELERVLERLPDEPVVGVLVAMGASLTARKALVCR